MSQSIPAMRPTRLTNINGKDEKRWRIEDAARTFTGKAEIEREIADIQADPELFKAVKGLLKQQADDARKALKS